jgi:hypothetical protein
MNLETLKNQTILLLGKPRAFSEAEFSAQLGVHNITVVEELREDVEYILEGRMLTPYEQNLSDKLYETKQYRFLKIDDFEKAMAEEIDDDVLLMSLKLSNDTERLKSFLQNGCVSDALFFKLLKMYKWQGEDFFENDDNRDVSAALIGRFYENIERNHNVQYATTGIIHLLSQTENPQLLEAISELEAVKFHPKIKILLAQHPFSSQKVLKKLLQSKEQEVLEAMSENPALEKNIALQLAQIDAVLAQKIAANSRLDDELFEKLLPHASGLGFNETLSEMMQRTLFDLDDEDVLAALAQNKNLSAEVLEKILLKQEELLTQALYKNPCVSSALLEAAYTDAKNHLSLAQNSATPQEILEKLYINGDADILDALARNEKTPVEILYQLQLDRRFERAVKTNRAFGKYIQSQNIGWL